VLFCFVDLILGNLTVWGHSLSQGTWGYRILTLHLNYVAGVFYFVFINPILGNCYSPGVMPSGRGPGVAGSSPSTLTTSLATPVPSSSSSNRPTTTPLTTRGLCPGGSVVWSGPKFVQPH